MPPSGPMASSRPSHPCRHPRLLCQDGEGPPEGRLSVEGYKIPPLVRGPLTSLPLPFSSLPSGPVCTVFPISLQTFDIAPPYPIEVHILPTASIPLSQDILAVVAVCHHGHFSSLLSTRRLLHPCAFQGTGASGSLSHLQSARLPTESLWCKHHCRQSFLRRTHLQLRWRL